MSVWESHLLVNLKIVRGPVREHPVDTRPGSLRGRLPERNQNLGHGHSTCIARGGLRAFRRHNRAGPLPARVPAVACVRGDDGNRTPGPVLEGLHDNQWHVAMWLVSRKQEAHSVLPQVARDTYQRRHSRGVVREVMTRTGRLAGADCGAYLGEEAGGIPSKASCCRSRLGSGFCPHASPCPARAGLLQELLSHIPPLCSTPPLQPSFSSQALESVAVRYQTWEVCPVCGADLLARQLPRSPRPRFSQSHSTPEPIPAACSSCTPPPKFWSRSPRPFLRTV
eukprot:scaffold803_cov310-Pinguiococcus_pyrenoidosus.AAC.112